MLSLVVSLVVKPDVLHGTFEKPNSKEVTY